MMLKIVCLLFPLVCCSQTYAQERAPSDGYLWPTNAGEYLTSTFGEYRPARYHTGIDVKTQGRIGFKCFAVRSGYVWRISVSPYGYGKALYLKLDTGETAVYAHLSRFPDRIQKLVTNEQRRAHRYRVNLFLKPDVLPVAQGDVIAYTGQTGIGAPHLHFELRDKSNNPTNPLLKGYELPDRVSPIVRAVSFTPLDEKSEVNQDFRPVIEEVQWVAAGQYEIKNPVSVWGNVGIAVRAHDKSAGAPNRFGVYQLKLFVDDVLRFEYSYDRLSFQTNSMSELERDYRLARRGLGRFYKLYKDRFNLKTYYKPNKTWAGVLSSTSLNAVPELLIDAEQRSAGVSPRVVSGALFPGRHSFRIELADFWGNTSMVRGQLQVGAAFDLHPVLIQGDSGELLLDDLITYDLTQVQDLDAFALNRSKWQKLNLRLDADTLALLEKGGAQPLAESQRQTRVILPSGQAGASSVILKFLGRDQFSTQSYPAFFVRANDAANVIQEFDISYDFYDSYVRLALDFKPMLLAKPAVTLSPGTGGAAPVALHQTDLGRYVGRIPLRQLQAGDRHPLLVRTRALNDAENVFSAELPATTVKNGVADNITSTDGRFRIAFNKASLYKPLYARIAIDSTTALTSYDHVGHIYKAEPADVLMKKGARVFVQYPDSTQNPEKLGVYYKSRKGKWAFIDNSHDPGRKTVSARVLSLEDFTLVRDDAPPGIWNIQPAPASHIRSRRPTISVNIKDKLSGIRSEQDLQLRLDALPVIPEYDPERYQLKYRPEQTLLPGRHEIEVVALDKSGNVAVKKSHFWID